MCPPPSLKILVALLLLFVVGNEALGADLGELLPPFSGWGHMGFLAATVGMADPFQGEVEAIVGPVVHLGYCDLVTLDGVGVDYLCKEGSSALQVLWLPFELDRLAALWALLAPLLV